MKWRVPLSDIAMGKEEEREVLKVLRTRWLSTGPVTERFEKAFSAYLGGAQTIAVSNGTAALHLALVSLNLRPGDEVILPSLTFAATANAVLYAGACPVFADISGPEDLNISPQEIKRKITRKTRAILVMHFAGFPCDMQPILELAKRHRLRVIEDAAHAPGATYRRKSCGVLGDVGCFSFFANKNLVTGEGGMVATRDPESAESIRRMRSHGMASLSWDKFHGRVSSYDIEVLGFNYRLTEIQSALGLVQLRKLDRNREKRRGLVEVYREELQGVKGVSIPFLRWRGEPSYHLFPILVDADRRLQLMEALRRSGIQTSVHFPPVYLFTLYRRRFSLRPGMLPKTEEAARREVTLPLHPRMKREDARWVAARVRDIAGRWN